MSRTVLPNRRSHEGFNFECWGQVFHAGVGRMKDDEASPILEVWINTSKSGTAAETYARDAAVLISLGLQYGIPLEAMRKTVMRNLDGTASGPIGRIVDLLANDSAAGSPVLSVVSRAGSHDAEPAI